MPGSPATSPRLAIPRYAQADAANFAAGVNAVVDQIDTVTPKFSQGTTGARPAASAVTGAFYWDTDQSQLFYSNGTFWYAAAGLQAGTLVSRPAAGISGRYYFASDEPALYVDLVTSWLALTPKWQTIKQVGIAPNWASMGADRTYQMKEDFTEWTGTGHHTSAQAPFVLSPADLPDGANGRMRLRIEQINKGGSTVGGSSTCQLYPVASWSGSPAQPVAGSAAGGLASAAFTSLAANAYRIGASSSFAVPAAGMYFIGGTLFASGWGAAADCILRAKLQWTSYAAA
jgi:hypothetical protein